MLGREEVQGRHSRIQKTPGGSWFTETGTAPVQEAHRGSGLELDETPEAGAVREILEKTGIHVEVDELTGVYKNTTRGIVVLVFRCKPSGGTERTSDESAAVSWLTPDEVSERMAEVYAIRLLDALDGNGPHVRSHDVKQLLRP
ncbi:NUDIX hydrolase [Streptomyces sp. QTS137]